MISTEKQAEIVSRIVEIHNTLQDEMITPQEYYTRLLSEISPIFMNLPDNECDFAVMNLIALLSAMYDNYGLQLITQLTQHYQKALNITKRDK